MLGALENFEADHGTAIVMETETGAIRAIANLGRTKEDKYYEKLNYAIGESHEPGSTFKLMALVAALEDQVIDTTTVFDTQNGELTFYGKYKVRDSRKGGYGKIPISEIFERSSNTSWAALMKDILCILRKLICVCGERQEILVTISCSRVSLIIPPP